MYVGQQWVPNESLLAALRDIYNQSPDKEVVIKADKRLIYKDVREIMQLVNRAGFPGAGIETHKRDAATGRAGWRRERSASTSGNRHARTEAVSAKERDHVTPLVDVVLVLLIIFMVITPMLQVGYHVNTPPEVESALPPPS